MIDFAEDVTGRRVETIVDREPRAEPKCEGSSDCDRARPTCNLKTKENSR